MKGFSEVFKPRNSLSEEEVQAGLKWWTREGTASQGFWSITTSGFLAAYALTLGCNNFQIGVLAAIPLLTQPLQIVFIPLVERMKWRKAIAFGAWVPAQLLWIPVALIPFMLEVPGAEAIALLLSLMAIRGVFVAASVCAWNGWIRDLIPQKILGSSFARRQARAMGVGMVFGLLAAFFVDQWEGNTSGDSQVWGYSFALLFGIFFLGLASPAFILKMPEPYAQPSPGPQPSLVSMMWEPFRDRNYRPLLSFLFFWGLALNLAIPFFAVYMLQRLEMPLTAVIGLSVLSQMFNIFFLRVWGTFSDQFGVKTILAMSASLYLLVILGWTFTTMPERYSFTIPLLIILHILAGVASAGVTLGTGTIAMKVAPLGKATAYLAVAAMATSLGAGLGPLIGGRFADYFSVRELGIDISWIDPEQIVELSALSFTGFDFLFGIAFVIGLFTLNALFAVREEGEVSRDMVLNALYQPGQQFTRPMTSVPGLNFLGQFPYGFMRRVPIPGLDVALGVTSYQIAQIARVATETAIRSGAATAKVSKGLQESLSMIARRSSRQEEPGHRFEVARQAIRGAIGAIDEANEDVEGLFKSAFNGVLRAFGWERVDLSEMIRGASYGAVQEAGESGGNTAKAAQMAIDAAQSLAKQTGRDETEAMTEAAAGALDAAAAISPEELSRVEQAIPAELIMQNQDEEMEENE